MDNTQTPDWSGVTAAQNQANQSATTANNFVAGGYSLADELRKAIGDRFAQSPVAGEAATARSNFLAAAPQARSDVANMVNAGTILSPSQQAAIMAGKRAEALAPLMTANSLESASFGTMQDLIDAGTNAYNAQSQKLQGQATIDQNRAAQLLQNLTTQAQITQAAQPKTTTFEDNTGHTWLVNATTGQKIEDLGPTYHPPTGVGADKTYPFTSPYIEAGLAGQIMTAAGNKFAADYIAKHNVPTAQEKADLEYKQAQTDALKNKGNNPLNAIWNYLFPVVQ